MVCDASCREFLRVFAGALRAGTGNSPSVLDLGVDRLD